LNEYSTAEYEKYHILLDGHIRRAWFPICLRRADYRTPGGSYWWPRL